MLSPLPTLRSKTGPGKLPHSTTADFRRSDRIASSDRDPYFFACGSRVELAACLVGANGPLTWRDVREKVCACTGVETAQNYSAAFVSNPLIEKNKCVNIGGAERLDIREIQ